MYLILRKALAAACSQAARGAAEALTGQRKAPGYKHPRRAARHGDQESAGDHLTTPGGLGESGAGGQWGGKRPCTSEGKTHRKAPRRGQLTAHLGICRQRRQAVQAKEGKGGTARHRQGPGHGRRLCDAGKSQPVKGFRQRIKITDSVPEKDHQQQCENELLEEGIHTETAKPMHRLT